MKAWQRENMRKWEQDRRAIMDDGYEIEQLADFHFRIRNDDSPDTAVDMWPSTRKLMQLGTTNVEKYGADFLMHLAHLFYPDEFRSESEDVA